MSFAAMFMSYFTVLGSGLVAGVATPVKANLSFSGRVVTPSGMPSDGAPPAVDAPQRLRYIVTKRAAEAGLVAVVWPRRFSYGAMFVELFWVCEAAALPRMPEPG